LKQPILGLKINRKAKTSSSKGLSMDNPDWPRRFSEQEMDYLTKLLPAMQNPIQISPVRMWLEKAQQDGLDPQRIYDAAVETRPAHWTPAPPFSDVNPNH
jgi:hypothetical protein